jgi:phage antirepressor YoqD-like protein
MLADDMVRHILSYCEPIEVVICRHVSIQFRRSLQPPDREDPILAVNRKLLRWLLDTGYTISPEIQDAVTRIGDLNTLKMFVEYDVRISPSVSFTAAEQSNLEILEWLRSERLPWNAYCASILDQELRDWLRMKNCMFTRESFWNACAVGDAKTVKWLRENGCLWNTLALTYALDNGNSELLEYLHDNKAPYHTIISFHCVQRGNLKGLKWLHSKKYGLDPKLKKYIYESPFKEFREWYESVEDEAVAGVKSSENSA